VPLVLDLRIAHDRWGCSSDPSINGHIHYPNDMDRSLNETVTDKIRKYCTDYNNNPPSSVVFMSPITSTSGRLHSEFVRLLFLQDHRKTDRFFEASGVQLPQHDRGQFHYKHVVFSSHLKSKVGNILSKDETLRITLTIDDAPVASRSHTHPSHTRFRGGSSGTGSSTEGPQIPDTSVPSLIRSLESGCPDNFRRHIERNIRLTEPSLLSLFKRRRI
jgi:hypothetical protein